MLRQLEKFLFGLFDLLIGRLIDRGILCGRRHVMADTDEFAPDAEVVDDARILGDIEDGRGDRGQPDQILKPSDFGECGIIFEIALQRDRRRDQAALDEVQARLIESPVKRFVEMVRTKKFRDAIARFIVEEDGAQHGLFRFEIVWHVAKRQILINRFGTECHFKHGSRESSGRQRLAIMRSPKREGKRRSS